MTTRTTLGWIPVSAEEQAEAARIVKAARHSLHGAGFDTRTPGFPYTLHHEHYRAKLRGNGYSPRHGHVAFLLNEWARQGEFAPSYAWQAVYGAVAAMTDPPSALLPEDVKTGFDTYAGKDSFESWLKENAASLKGVAI